MTALNSTIHVLKNYIFAMVVVLLFFILNLIIVILPSLFTHDVFQWNYIGKLLELLWPLIFIYFLCVLNPKDAGLGFPKSLDILLVGFFIGAVFATSILLFDWHTHALPSDSLITYSTIIFQFTLPGLAEELVYRGFLYGLFNRLIAVKPRFISFPINSGIIFVSLLFILVHVINYNRHEGRLVLSSSLPTFIPLILMIIILGWLRIKSSTIWPGIICHNTANGLYFLVLFTINVTV